MLKLALLLSLASTGLGPVAPPVASAASVTSADDLIRKGEHFELVCHFQNEQAADQAFAAVEATWEFAEQLYGLDKESERELLRVHLYRNEAEYAAAEQELTQGKFRRNLAFAHFDSMSAHVALQPPLVDASLAELGLPVQTVRLLAHEAAHLIRYAHFSNFRSHPGWLADGSASWIDEMVLSKLGLVIDPEKDPNFSTAMVSVQKLMERDALPNFEQVLADQTDDLEFYERYNVRWMVFRFLAQGKQRDSLVKLIACIRPLGGGEGFVDRAAEAVKVEFGASKYQSIDKALRRFIKSLDPAWEEIYRSLQGSGNSWTQSAFESKNAIAWRREKSGKKYSLVGELTLLPGPRQQMNLFLGRNEKGFLSIAFTAGQGVNLFEFLSETNDWQNRGFAECKDLRTLEAFRFKVSVDGKDVSLEVNGKPLLSGAVQTISLEGPWGLSAQSGSTGKWVLKKAPGL